MELSEQPDGSFARGFGGDTLNTAVYLARLGLRVDYVTALGTDPFSDEMVAAWHREGIGTDLVLRCPDTLPGLYMIQTDARGERRFSYWRDSAPVRRLLSLPEMGRIEAALLRHDLIYLSGITLSLFDASGRARLFAILDHLRANGGRVVFDTNFRPRGWPDRAAAQHAYREMLHRCDTVLASTEDLELLRDANLPAGPDFPAGNDAILSGLRACGMDELVLKLREPGCLVVAAGGETIHVPAATQARVVDTTAAGDSFAAAFIAARAAGLGLREAAENSHRLAGAVIAYRGAIIPLEGMPRLAVSRPS